jgi:MFS family permease
MFGRTKTKEAKVSAIGEDLARLLPDNGPWYKQRHLLLLNFYVFSMCLLTAANGYDGSMMNGLMALPQWHEFMDHPTGAWLGFINAVQALSSTFAYPLVAYFANRWGRKKGLYVGLFFLFAGALLQAFTPNITGFVISRAILGQPSAWWGGLAPLLVTELAYPSHRAFLTAALNSGWYVGSTIAAWATFGTRNYSGDWAWRIPSLLQIAVPVVVIPGLLMIPESPRYLISKGQTTKAREILTKYHAGGNASPLVDFEMAEIEAAIEADKAAANSSSWGDLFKGKGNRHRALISMTLGVFAQWNGVGVVSYYLALVLQTVGITSVTDQTLISGFLQIWNLFWAVLAAAYVDKLGRRPLFLISSVGMLVSFIIISGLSGGFATTGASSVGLAVVPFLYIYFAFYDVALYVSSPQMPLSRSDGMKARLTDLTTLQYPSRHCLPSRDLALPAPSPRHRLDSNVDVRRHLLQHLRQPHCARGHRLEVLHCLRCHPRFHHCDGLLLLSRDKGSLA